MPKRKLLKKEVKLITKNAKGYYREHMELAIMYVLDNSQKECHIRDNEKRMQICRTVLSNTNLMHALFDKNSDLYA